MKGLWPVLVIVAAGAAGSAAADEFRRRMPIAVPVALPEGARPVMEARPVPRGVVEKAVRDLFAAYGSNTAAMDRLLGEDFFDRSRLLDAMAERLPRDARLKILGMGSPQILNRFVETGASGRDVLVSRVAVVVRGQLEFNDPAEGFQRIEGTSEYIILVRQETLVGPLVGRTGVR